MKQFLRAALAAVILSLGIGPVSAQIAPPFVLSGNLTQPTYSASIGGLVPAASATDWFTITGSAGKLITVIDLRCVGLSTANAAQPITMLRRSTANSAGTSTTPTAVPHNTASPAATAVVRAYTANPTVGTLIGNLRSHLIVTGPAATATVENGVMVWNFGTASPGQGIQLNGTGAVLALNGNGASYSAGTAFSCSVTWTEI